jgi:hypothetical protein
MRRREFITLLAAQQFMAATALGFFREHRDDNQHT